MASGGGDRRPWNADKEGQQGSCKQATRVEVGDQARVLITGFVHERMEADGLAPASVPRQEDLFEPGTPRGDVVMASSTTQEVASYLKRIGDGLDSDKNLQRLVNSLPTTASKATFFNVAREIFADNIFNWERVVALFYFAYKMAKKAVGQLSIIRTVIEWVVSFITDYVSEWIIGRGGWVAIAEYFGSSWYQWGSVSVAGILAVALVWFSRRGD